MGCFVSEIESTQPAFEYRARFPLESGLNCYVW